jgi:hypothetical protein
VLCCCVAVLLCCCVAVLLCCCVAVLLVLLLYYRKAFVFVFVVRVDIVLESN